MTSHEVVDVMNLVTLFGTLVKSRMVRLVIFICVSACHFKIKDLAKTKIKAQIKHKCSHSIQGLSPPRLFFQMVLFLAGF